MNRAFWLILNLVLLAAAAWTTNAIISPTRPSPESVHSERDEANPRDVASRPSPPSPRQESDKRRQTVLDEISTLWQRTLFNPRRTEEIAAEGEPAPETAREPYDFELLGIGIVGKRAAAIIWVHRSRRTSTIRSRRVSPTVARRSSVSKTKPGDAQKDRPRVYRLGDEVEDTGYVVKEILQDQVTLLRGEEKKVLKLDRSDEGTTKRTEAAAREEEKRMQAQKARLAAAARTAPPHKPPVRPPSRKVLAPPPPPPAPAPPPGGAGGVKPPSVTRSQMIQDRIRRALEARKRTLERYRSAAPPK